VIEVGALREEDPLFVSACRKQGGYTVRAAVIDLRKLALLGFDKSCAAVRDRAEFLFSVQQKDGSWPIERAGSEASPEVSPRRERYEMIPLQTALPLIGLSACGYAEDKRAEKAYDWLESKRLEDGAWPTGVSSGVFGRVAGYRRLPHSRWGCRSNTTGALMALCNHPERRTGPAAKKAAGHLLAREIFDASELGFETARSIGAERTRGMFTFFAGCDPGMLIELASRAAFSRSEPRVAKLLQLIEGERRPDGLWRYEKAPQASRWVTFSILKTFKNISDAGELYGEEPATPFSEYPRKQRRF